MYKGNPVHVEVLEAVRVPDAAAGGRATGVQKCQQLGKCIGFFTIDQAHKATLSCVNGGASTKVKQSRGTPRGRRFCAASAASRFHKEHSTKNGHVLNGDI